MLFMSFHSFQYFDSFSFHTIIIHYLWETVSIISDFQNAVSFDEIIWLLSFMGDRINVNDFQNFVSFNEIIWLLVDSTNSIMFEK